jgi:alkylresorcinol/alkylpyrone synthase
MICPSILGITSAVPSNRCEKRDVMSVGEEWLGAYPPEKALFERFVSSSMVDSRYFCTPLDQVLSLKSLSIRAALFQEHGVALGVQVAKVLLDNLGISAEEIDTVVFVSCSIPSIPAIDVVILSHLEIPSSVRRVPIYQYGCGGGVAGLALAGSLSSLSRAYTLFLSIELCSLLFWRDDISASQLVGASLFGDGAAAAILSTTGVHSSRKRGNFLSCDIVGSQSYRVSDSFNIMGYTLEDDGPHLYLGREIPERVVTVLPSVVDSFLKANSLARYDIREWYFHPGGAKILSFLEEEFLPKDRLSSTARATRAVFAERGNMSSSTILHVMEHALMKAPLKAGEYGMVLGIGPGLVLELMLIRGDSSVPLASQQHST